MNMQEIYLPAMLWLRKDGAGRLFDKSSKTRFPDFDHSLAIPGSSYPPQLIGNTLEPGPKGQRKGSKILPVNFEGTTPEDLYDELFLPSEKKWIESNFAPRIPLPSPNSSRHTAQPTARCLHPAQSLPKSETSINGLPACLVAGCHPSRSAQRSMGVSNISKEIHEAAGVGQVPQNQTQSSVKYRGGTSVPHEEWPKSSTYRPWTGQNISTAQMSDPVESAQLSYRSNFKRQPENKNLQGHASLSYEIPPLPVRSPFRPSAVLSAAMADSRSINKTPQSLVEELHPYKKSHDNVRNEKGNPTLHSEVANFPSFDICKTQQRVSNSKYHQISIPQTRLNPEHSMQGTNQNFLQHTSLSPEIPPVRPVSILRFSHIFPNFPESSATVSPSNQAASHQYGDMSTNSTPRKHFPGSFDRIYGDAMELKEQRDILKGKLATVPGQETFHKQLRRRKGYENLRMASIPH